MNKERKHKLSIIVPVYNESRTIDQVIRRLLSVDLGPVDREVIIVDDCSGDDSFELLKRLQGQFGDILKLRQNPINLGKGAAVRVGFQAASGDIVTIQDADLELDPAEYRRLLVPILEGRAKVVYGSRFKAPTRKFPRSVVWPNKFLTFLTNLLYNLRLTDMETCYKVMSIGVLKDIRLRCVGFDIEPDITTRLAQAGHKIIEIPIDFSPRTVDQGKKISWRDGLDAVYILFKNRFVS